MKYKKETITRQNQELILPANNLFNYKNLLQSMYLVLKGIVFPRKNIQTLMTDSILVITGCVMFLLTLTVILVLTYILNHNEILYASQNITSLTHQNLSSAGNPFLFPLYWLLLLIFITGVRFGLLVLLDEDKRSLQSLFIFSFLAVIPIMFVGGVQGTINNLFPIVPEANPGWLPFVRIYSGLIIFLFAYLWEGFLSTVYFQQIFTINKGKAFLIWAAPTITVFIIFPVYFILSAF